MIIRPKDGRGCDCNPLDSIIMRLEELERRAQFIVARVQGIAPDGEGNVTLPTSESIDGPLFGSIQAFSMSSEVKGAYDDLHAYASAIADDIIEVRSDIVDLDRRIDELEPEGVDALQNAVDALSMAVDSLRADKVNKAGDTMTGGLLIQKTTGGFPLKMEYLSYDSGLILKRKGVPIDAEVTDLMSGGKIYFQDDGDVNFGVLGTQKESTFNQIALCSYRNGKSQSLQLINAGDTGFAKAPSWSVGTNDNSDKILTIKMANSLPSLVHTTGNETVAGTKTFSNAPLVTGGRIRCLNTNLPSQSAPTSYQFNQGIIFEDSASKEVGAVFHQVGKNSTTGETHITAVSNGPNRFEARITVFAKDNKTGYAVAPTTPTDATSNEIATADWVLDKINAFAAANGLTGV